MALELDEALNEEALDCELARTLDELDTAMGGALERALLLTLQPVFSSKMDVTNNNSCLYIIDIPPIVCERCSFV